jgi:hypothetical protein
VYCLAGGGNTLQISVKSIWSFNSEVSLSIFCLDYLSIGSSGVLKFTSIVVLGPSVFLSPMVYV